MRAITTITIWKVTTRATRKRAAISALGSIKSTLVKNLTLEQWNALLDGDCEDYKVNRREEEKLEYEPRKNDKKGVKWVIDIA